MSETQNLKKSPSETYTTTETATTTNTKDENDSNDSNHDITTEDIYDYVGGMGRYQIFVCLFLAYATIPNGIGAYLVNYTQLGLGVGKWSARCFLAYKILFFFAKEGVSLSRL